MSCGHGSAWVDFDEGTGDGGSMTEPPHEDSAPPADEGLIAWTHVIYGLHSLAVLIGVTSAATVVGAFVFSVPSIVAVVLSYLKRGEAQGSFLESHYRWLIRTFWFAVMWGAIVILVMLVLATASIRLVAFLPAPLQVLLLPIGGIILVAGLLPVLVVGVWLIYRIARGWLALKDGKPLPAA